MLGNRLLNTISGCNFIVLIHFISSLLRQITFTRIYNCKFKLSFQFTNWQLDNLVFPITKQFWYFIVATFHHNTIIIDSYLLLDILFNENYPNCVTIRYLSKTTSLPYSICRKIGLTNEVYKMSVLSGGIG